MTAHDKLNYDAYAPTMDEKGQALLHYVINHADWAESLLLINVSADGKIDYLTEAIFHILGYQPTELLGLSFAETLLTKSSQKLFAQYLTDLSQGELTQNYDYFDYRTKNGATVRLSWVAQPFLGLNNDLGSLVMLLFEMAVGDGQHERLEFDHLVFEAIFRHSPDAYFVLDQSRRLVLLNPAFEALFNVQSKDLLGRYVDELYASKDEYGRLGYGRKQLDGRDRGQPFSVRYRKQDGSLFLGETVGSILRSSTGQVLGYVGVVRDISRRETTEYERARIQSQLLRAQKMEALGQLTGGVAHNFNNILSSVLGYVMLCQRELEKGNTEKGLEYLGQVKSSGERARDLIEQMLAFSDSGALKEVRSADLEALLDEVLQIVRSGISSSIEIRQQLECEHRVRLQLDLLTMQQLLMSLCINARESMGESGILQISCEIVNEAEGYCQSCHQTFTGNFAKVTVEDSGSGVPETLRERIFEPFFTTHEIGVGTGMGLASVHGIMHNLNGHIVVSDSALGGAKFELMIPLENKEDTVSGTDNTDVMNLAGRHIMVVDDEEMLLRLMKELMQDQGATVETWRTAEQALGAFTKAPDLYDVVMTDQTMPGMLGIELLKAIKQQRPSLPVILCTGYSETLDEQVAREAGADLFLMKPLDPDLICMQVSDLISRK